MPIYNVDGETYNISDKEVKAFESDFPDAKVRYSVDGEDYDIAITEREDFLKDFPDAKYSELQESQPQQNGMVAGTVAAENGMTFTEAGLDSLENGATPVYVEGPKQEAAVQQPTNWRDEPLRLNPGEQSERTTTHGEVYDTLYKHFGDIVANGQAGERSAYSQTYEKALQMGIDDDDEFSKTRKFVGTINRQYAKEQAAKVAEQLVSQMPEHTSSPIDDLKSLYYNRDLQQRLWKTAAAMGNDYSDYVNMFLKPQLVEALKKKYGGDDNEWIGVRGLFSDWQNTTDELERNDVAALLQGNFAPTIEDAFSAGDDAANDIMREHNESVSPYTDPGMDFGAIGATRKANEERDPDKILRNLENTVGGAITELLQNPQLADDIFKRAEQRGITAGQYIDQFVTPQMIAALRTQFEQEAIRRQMPRSQVEYILRGFEDSIVGMLANRMMLTESQQRYRNMADAMTVEGKNPDVQPNVWAEGGRLAVGMANDFWLWSGWGQIGAAATGELLAQRIAARAIQDKITMSAARRLIEEEGKQFLSKGVVEQMMRHIPQSAITMAGAEATTAAAQGIRDRADAMEVLGSIFSSATSGATTGTLFGVTGGFMGRLTSQLEGVKRLAGKLAGFGVEASTMYTAEELQKMAAGEDAFSNPLEDLYKAGIKLGFIKLSANPAATGVKLFEAMAHPVKAIREAMKPDKPLLTEDDVQAIRDSQSGQELMDALVAMRPARSTDPDERLGDITEEQAARGAEAYRNFMLDPEHPYERKQKVARLLGGLLPPPGFEVSVDVTPVDGGAILRTRDIDGQLIRELRYDSVEDAEAAIPDMNKDLFDNTTKALERELLKSDVYRRFLDSIEQRYQEIVAQGDAEEALTLDRMSEEDRTIMYLHQHMDEALDIYQKMASGQDVGVDGEKVTNALLRYFEQYVKRDEALKEVRRDYEYANDLKDGTIDDAIKNGTTEDYKLLSEYQEAMRQRLSDLGREVGKKDTESFSDDTFDVRPDEEPSGTEPRPTGTEPRPDGGATGTVARTERRQAAYERGMAVADDETQLPQVRYDSKMAEARMMQSMPDGSQQEAVRRQIMDAVQSGDVDGAERILAQQMSYLSEQQREAVENYLDSAVAGYGVSDAIQQNVESYEQQVRDRIHQISDDDGNVTKLRLKDGSMVYYQAGDLNGFRSSVFVVTEDGERKQISTKDIDGTEYTSTAEDMIAEMVQGYSDELANRYNMLSDGSLLYEGQEVDIVMGNQLFRVTALGTDEQGNNVIRMEDGSRMALTPEDTRDAVDAADYMRIQQLLGQEQADRNLAAQQERFSAGIKGYDEGTPMLSHKDTKPEIAAEYLLSQTGDDGQTIEREKVLAQIQQEIDSNSRGREQALQALQQAKNDLAMAEDSSEEARKAQAAINELEPFVEDMAAQRRKWGEIRQAMMTDEERSAFEKDRTRAISKSREQSKRAVRPDEEPSGTVTAPTAKEMLEEYAERTGAEAFVEAKRKELSDQYKNEVYPEWDNLQKQLDDYQHGLTDLTTDEIKAMTDRQTLLEQRMAQMVQAQNAWKKLLSDLPRAYSAREREQLTPYELAMSNIAKESDKQKKLKLAQEAFKGDEDALAILDDLEPRDVYEWVADNLGKGSINWEGLQRGEHAVRGLISEMGRDKKRGVGAGYDTNGYNYFLAPTGQGKGIDEVIHAIAEGSPYDTEQVREALLSMLKDAQKPTDISHRIIDDRIAQADSIYQENMEREREAQIAFEDEAFMQTTGMTREEYDDYVSSLEQALAEQEGFANSEDYFKYIEEYEQREIERRAGGSQAQGTLAMQGQEGQPLGAEANTQRGDNAADGVVKHFADIQSAVDEHLKTYRTLAPIEVVDTYSDDALRQIFGEDSDTEAVRQYLKEFKLPAAYDPIQKKIYIFAENIETEDIEEAIFHENIHRGLHQYYGDGLREVSEAFWNTESAKHPEVTAEHKAAIQERYEGKSEEEQHEEYLVHVFAHQMTTGKADALFERLSPEHQEIIGNILKNVGYDRATETAKRQGESASGNQEALSQPVPAAEAEGRVGDEWDAKLAQLREKYPDMTFIIHHADPDAKGMGVESSGTWELRGQDAELVSSLMGPFVEMADDGTIRIDGDDKLTEVLTTLVKNGHRASVIDKLEEQQEKPRITETVGQTDGREQPKQATDEIEDTAGETSGSELTADERAALEEERDSLVRQRNKLYKKGLRLGIFSKDEIQAETDKVNARLKEVLQQLGETQTPISAPPFSARLAAAKEETNTNPTEEQKKAGNYKMGHISFGGYRMSIENPKGSVRSGVDANGQPWSIEMQDTYGYIGKKYGVDGDHLDFFINDDADLDTWNGRVYVVDQKNEDGTFDEHKVMYGYPTFSAARRAYERNYEAGWWDKHVMQMTGMKKADFDKWLADSDRKTKPFAEYSRTKKADTVSDPVDQLLADVEERKSLKPAEGELFAPEADATGVDRKPVEEPTGTVAPSFKDGELEKKTIAELEQARKKKQQDLSTSKYLLGTTNVQKGGLKERTLKHNIAQAEADIAAIDKMLEQKRSEHKQRIEQQEIGFAITDQLEGMGFDIESNPSEVRRVRKQAEKDNSEEGKLRHLKTSDGQIYGFVYRGKMYLDIRKIDATVPLHEYGHPWCEAFRKLNPEGWKAVVETMKTDKDTWEFVKQLNPDLTNDDDIAEEMIAKGTGEKGAEYARKEYERMNGRDPEHKRKWNNIWQNIAKAIQDFWKQIGDYLHIKYKSPEQVYDQVIRDFANKVNPRKKIEKWLKERDKSYLEAVESGDDAKAKELFDAALRENVGNGMTPYIAVEGYRKMRPLAHGVKTRDPKVIAKVADMMAPLIPQDAVLVPAPSHTGKATDMLDLAQAISERTGAPVADVLTSKERPSQYEAKYAGKPLTADEMGIEVTGEPLPAGKLPVVIDNVVDTGNTAEACIKALGKGVVASLADSVENRKHVTSLKSAEPVVTDKNGNVVPLSERFMFMVEGNLFSDEDFEEPARPDEESSGTEPEPSGTEPKPTGIVATGGQQPGEVATYSVGDKYHITFNGEPHDIEIIGISGDELFVNIDDMGNMPISATVLDQFVREANEPKSAVDSLLDEAERRQEEAKDRETADDIVKKYFDEMPKDAEGKVRQRATKAVLTALDNAGVPYKVVSKQEERQMIKLFSLINQEAVKEFARNGSMRAMSPHGVGRYIVYNMNNPFGVPMYFKKQSTAKWGMKSMKRLVPGGDWAILDIGWAGEPVEENEMTRRAAEYSELMLMMGGNKKASEPAVLGDKSLFKAAAISNADAKVRNNLETLVKESENLSGEQKKHFLAKLSEALGAVRQGSGSRYVDIEAKNGTVVTLRLADHNVTVSNFDYSGKPNGVSIVISRQLNNGVTNDGNAHIIEYFYPDKELRKADGHPYAEIVKSVQQMLYSGEYTDTTGIAKVEEVNRLDNLELMMGWHGSGAQFDKFDHRHMGSGEGNQSYGWGTYITEVEGIGRMYAESMGSKHVPANYKGVTSTSIALMSEDEYKKLGAANEAQRDILARIVGSCNFGYGDPVRMIRVQRESLQEQLERKLAVIEDAKEQLEEEKLAERVEHMKQQDRTRPIAKERLAEAEKRLERLNNRIRINEKIVKETQESLAFVDSLDPKDFKGWSKPNGSFLYKVDIPEDTGDNYFDWTEHLTDAKADELLAEVRDILLANEEYGWNGNEQRLDKQLEAMKSFFGGAFYGHMSVMLGNSVAGAVKKGQRMASELLSRHGYVGIKYPAEYRSGGREDGAKNYVIFNEDDAKITETIQFMVGGPDEEPSGTVAPVFYSNAMRAVEGIKQEKATAEQWLAMIQKNGGLKAGEDKWLNLSDWLNERKGQSVTKQEVLDYIRQNQIQVEDVNYSENASREGTADKAVFQFTNSMTKEAIALSKEKGIEVTEASEQLLNERYGDKWDEYLEVDSFGIIRSLEFTASEDIADFFGIDYDGKAEKLIDGTRLDYTTEGLDNKREIALVVPNVEPYNESDQIHFGDAGGGRAVAWVRFGDTTTGASGRGASRTILDDIERRCGTTTDYSKMSDEDAARRAFANYLYRDDPDVDWMRTSEIPGDVGAERAENVVAVFDKLVADSKNTQKVLVIDEIQSKRHQDAREKGYITKEYQQELEKLTKAYRKTQRELDDFEKHMIDKYDVFEEVKTLTIEETERRLRNMMTEAEVEEYDNLLQANEQASMEKSKFVLANGDLSRKVPEAPFEKNWHELAMKRMLRYAAENGYDKIAWTTGAQQAERYNLSNVVNHIDVGRWGEDVNQNELDVYDTYKGPSSWEPSNEVEKSIKDYIEYCMSHGDPFVMSIGYAKNQITDAPEESKGWTYELVDKVADAIEADVTGKKDMRGVVIDLKGEDDMIGMVVNRDGRIVDSSMSDFEGKSLADVVGKEVALKIINTEDKGKIYGNGLRIGGEGMKGFYDDMLVRFMNKYGKKWGVKVEDIDLPEIGQRMHVVDVTPEMKESVMQGQPLFHKQGKQMLGWTDGKQIFLTQAGLNPNTPLHETTHMWDKWCQQAYPELWKKVVAALKQTEMWKQIAENPNYRNIWNDENRMASEVHSRLTGAVGEDEFMRAAFNKSTPKKIIEEVKSVLRKFWERILQLFGKHSKIVGSDWDSLDAIVRMPIRDLLNEDFEKVMRTVGLSAEAGGTGRSADAMRGETIRKTLMGVHNISEEKLKKVIKAGGLANPSLAVVNTDNGIHTSYGDISLIPKASLIDARTGRNAGTFAGDAYTPTYPHVERMVTKQGEKSIERIAKETAGEDEDLARHLRNNMYDYAEGNASRLHLLYLIQKGLKPEIRQERIDHSKKEFDAITKIFGEPKSTMPSDLTKEQSDALVDLMVGLYEKKLRGNSMNLRDKEKIEELIQGRIEEYRKKITDENGRIWFAEGDNFVHGNWRDEQRRNNPKPDWYGTDNDASYRVAKEGLAEDYERWKEEQLFGDGDFEEKLFAGYDRDGNRKYLPNTVENASRLMNRHSDTNAYDQGGLNATKSSLLKRMNTLSDIRKARHLLQGEEAYNESQKAASDELFDIIHQLSDMQKISDNPYSNIDYAEARLQEAITKRDPIGYLNKEYGYDIDKDGEYAAQIMNFIEAAKNLPAKYFETKFKRPVTLNEFAIAVVPESTSPEVIQALKDAGLEVHTYTGDDRSEDRTKVVMDAVGMRDDIMFHIEDDPTTLEWLDSEPTEVGYRTVEQVDDKTMRSPMADKLGKKGMKKVRNSAFSIDEWERSDENPQLATDDGKIDLEDIQGVDYNPYIHIRPDAINTQFKAAWRRPELVYVKTLYPKSELVSGYKAEKAKLTVGRHPWSGGTELILSRWDKPVEVMSWEEVADVWEKQFKKTGVHFDIVSPHLLPILAERGVKILPPHKGMGKACNEAYEKFKAELAAKPQEIFDLSKTKCVDDNGEPLVVYRGGTAFDENTIKNASETAMYGKAFYATPSIGGAEEYAIERTGDKKNIQAVYIDVRNPFVDGYVDGFNHPDPASEKEVKALIDLLEKKGLKDAKEWFFKWKNGKINGSLLGYLADANYEGLERPNFAFWHASGIVQEALKELGYDGVIGMYSGEIFRMPQVAVFDMKQVKRAETENDIRRSRGQRLEAHDTTGFAEAAAAAGEKLGGIGVQTVTYDKADANMKAEIENGTKGIFNPNTGEVTLLLDNIENVDDAVRTVFHEKLGHEGLVALLGSQEEVNKFGTFVFRSAGKTLRQRIMEKADEIDPQWTKGNRFSEAAQEVMGDIAADGPRTDEEFSLWTKVKHYLIRLCNKIGLRIRGLLNDKDLTYYIVKTGEALKRWNKMSEEEKAALARQAEDYDILRSRHGKPRKRNNESDAQYFQRLREWEKWRAARQTAKDNGDPEPEEVTFHEQAEADFKADLQEWKERNGIPAADATGVGAYPRRQDGESPQEFAMRVAEYEAQSDLWKTAPKLMDYLAEANSKYRQAYTEWRERYDLQEQESVDQRLFEGDVDPNPTFTDADMEAEALAEKDLAEAVGMEVDEAGAKRHAKLAIIERRKNMESANAEDAIWIYDFVKQTDDLAGKLQGAGKVTGKELRAALPFLIEAERRKENLEAAREDAVQAINMSDAIQQARSFIDYRNLGEISDELNALNAAWQHQQAQPDPQAKQAYRDAAARLAEKLNMLNKDLAGYNNLYADDVMQIRSLLTTASVTGLGDLMPDWAQRYVGRPEVQQVIDHIKEWYDEFFQVLEDAGLRGDAGYIGDGYVNHVWDKEKSDPKAWEKFVENRQRTKSPNMRHREIDTYMDGIEIGLVPKYTDIADMIAHYSRQNNEAVANRRFLDDLQFVVVEEMNDAGEVTAILPLIEFDKPSSFVRERYSQYYVPGCGDVYVLKHIQQRFDNIFGSIRTPGIPDWLRDIAKAYDLTSSTAKKIQLALSGFHALALFEVDMAQNNPVKALKHLFKYIIADSVKAGTLPAYAHPEDFQLAAKHLVQLGATEDYAAADVNAITQKIRDAFKEWSMSDEEWKKAIGVAGSPVAIFMDWINKGFDTVLWNYLHDGLKLCAFKELAKQVDRRVAKIEAKGQIVTNEERERLLDEAGQYVNDMFGGQYWELINVSPATLKWMRRAFLSPDWLISTQRHFLANFGFGSIYSESGFRNYIKYNADNIKRLFGADIAHDELRRLRSKNAKYCYLIGAMVWWGLFYNAINALCSWKDEEDEKAKAEEMRKTNPDYKSPYELVYPDGMKWYDYTMYGNSIGQNTHLFTGRYADGTETYVRWGKQFREFPELFIGRHGLEFPAPIIQRMMSKANPNIGTAIDFFGAQNIGGFNGSYENKELREKYGKTVATLAAMARHFIPFGIPTQAEKEYKWLDFFMPSSKGFSRWKAKDYFETFILDGDWDGIEQTYNACVMNGIDAEKNLDAAIASIKAAQKKELTDGITDLSTAVAKFDEATDPDKRKLYLSKIKKYLKADEYKVFTREEAIEKVKGFLDGDAPSEKENTRYMMLATSEDIIAEEKLKDLGRKARKFKEELEAKKGTPEYAELRERYGSWLRIGKIVGKSTRAISKSKKQLGGMHDEELMNSIRERIKSTQELVDELEAPE